MPSPAPPRQHAAGVELAGNCPEAGRPAGSDVLDHRRKVLRVPVGVARDGRPERSTAPAGAPQGLSAVGVAEAHTAAPRHGQRLLGALRDRLPLRLRHQRHDARR